MLDSFKFQQVSCFPQEIGENILKPGMYMSKTQNNLSAWTTNIINQAY